MEKISNVITKQNNNKKSKMQSNVQSTLTIMKEEGEKKICS